MVTKYAKVYELFNAINTSHTFEEVICNRWGDSYVCDLKLNKEYY